MRINLPLCIVLFLNTHIIFSQTKIFTVDFSATNGNIRKLTSVNMGPNTVSTAGTATLCYNDIGVDMVRTHDYHGPCDYYGYSKFYNTFNKQFDYNFNAQQSSSYVWSSTDNQINEIVNSGQTPFFRLGNSFSSSNDPETPMPKDADGINFKTFASICRKTAEHYTDGWDNGFYHYIPYWEVWNEPNHAKMWEVDSIQAYYRMYKQVSDSIKAFDNNLMVGGAGTAKNSFYTDNSPVLVLKQAYLSEFFQYCKNYNAHLDFYSFHSYDKKNPYHIKILADTIAHYLNASGFNNTELMLTESNIYEPENISYQNSAKGSAYITSTLITALDTRIKGVFWYRGVDIAPLCNADEEGSPSLTFNAYAYKMFNDLSDNTPLRLSTGGNEVVTTDINDTSKNLMITAGKESTNKEVKILISNLASNYTDFKVEVNNLPWKTWDVISVKVEKLYSSGYLSTSDQMSGGAKLTVNIPSVSSESTYLVTLTKESPNALATANTVDETFAFPNPADNVVNFANTLKNVQVFDLNGRLMIGNIPSADKIEVQNFQNGVYFIQAENAYFKFVVQH